MRMIGTTCILLAMAGALSSALAQSPDPQKLIEALKEKGVTRGTDAAAIDDPEAEKRRKVIEALQNREKLRALSVPVRDAPANPVTPAASVEELTISADVEEVAADRPKVDVEIFFGYNSDAISREAKPALIALGKSLSSKELKGQTFLLAGHTDAKGGRDYNKELSERRALAVKNYLMREFSIPEAELAVIGEGPDKPKVKGDPYAAANRRVEVVNMGQVALGPSDQ